MNYFYVSIHKFCHSMKKKLVRKDKKIFGVCGGLGDYFDIDPTIVRVLFIIAFLGLGSGLLLYIILALIMPEDSTSA
jgi:phage shock protein C